MYHHVKKLMYTVNVGEPDPKFGKMLLEQFGGANGELAAAMQNATRGANPLTRAGLAYIEFANQNRGLFRLMFGPILAERTKYPALLAASTDVEAMLVRGVTDLDPRPLNDNHAAMAAWGLVHGLAHLIVDGFFPAARAKVQAEEILAKIRLPRPPTAEAAQ